MLSAAGCLIDGVICSAVAPAVGDPGERLAVSAPLRAHCGVFAVSEWQDCYQHGAFGYAQKPLDGAVLLCYSQTHEAGAQALFPRHKLHLLQGAPGV